MLFPKMYIKLYQDFNLSIIRRMTKKVRSNDIVDFGAICYTKTYIYVYCTFI